MKNGRFMIIALGLVAGAQSVAMASEAVDGRLIVGKSSWAGEIDNIPEDIHPALEREADRDARHQCSAYQSLEQISDYRTREKRIPYSDSITIQVSAYYRCGDAYPSYER